MLGSLILVESALSYPVDFLNQYRQYFSSSIAAFPKIILTQLFYLPTKTRIYYNLVAEEEKENDRD